MRKDITRLALLPIMVDKMHIAGHVDAWCLENCDSRKIKALEEVCWGSGELFYHSNISPFSR